MNNVVSEIIDKSLVLKVGSVISVEGRTIKVLVDREKNVSHLFYKGELIKSIVVGSYIKITKGFEELVGKIEGEYIEEDIFQSRKNYASDTAKIKRILIISLLGYFNNFSFERGIKELPLTDNECFLLDDAEFNKVHNFIKEGDEPIHIGQLAQERGMPINLGINGLFASHIGIFGNTGSGKSYTLANLYHTLFQKYKDRDNFKKKASFFLIDFNGEYVKEGDNENIIIESAYKNTYRLSTQTQDGCDKFPIPEKVIQEPLMWTVLLEATEKTQKPFISRVLKDSYLENQLSEDDKFKQYVITLVKRILESNDGTFLDLPARFLADVGDAVNSNDSALGEIADKFREQLNYHGNENNSFYFQEENARIYSNNSDFDKKIDDWFSNFSVSVSKINKVKLIEIKILCKYYDEIVRGYSNQEHLAPLIKRMETKISDLEKVIEVTDSKKGKNITIVSLKDVNLDMKKILPLLFCKHLYDEKKKENKNQETFLNIIIDEAHNIMSESSQRESEQWKDYRLETFEEIIKEGRKFGVFLTIASQRPSDISSTIISQLHNYFLHRLINNNDIRAIERTVSYLDKVSFESLPILPTGTCILAGLVAQVPVVIEMNKIDDNYKPFNQTIEPTKHWTD